MKQWKDFAAVSSMSGNRKPITFPDEGWAPNNMDHPIKITCVHNDISTFLPLHYEKGTIISRVRAKFQGIGASDGIKLRIVKRDESTTDTAWTVIGSEQTWTSTSVIVSTYNPTDFEMLEDFSYAIEITSKVGVTAVSLFSVGVETNARLL